MPAGYDGEFAWDFLKPAFHGTKIEPMDIDAIVERNGHRLIFETKSHGESIPMGQQITLKNEWRLGATIFHIEGKTPESIKAYAIYREGEFNPEVAIGSKALNSANHVDVAYAVRRWFCWANNRKAEGKEEFETYSNFVSKIMK